MKRSSRRAVQQLRRDARKQRKRPKDAVLHLRIEEETMARIKAEAKARQMSISDLVRGHLAKHFAPSEKESDQPAFLAATFAWADVVVAQETRCAKCGKALPGQSHGWLAQGPPPPTRIVCGTCYDTFQTEKQLAPTGQEEEVADVK